MPTQTEKGQAFRALHERDSAFIIPNPWDAGSAKLLAHLGFEALATTSAGYAFSAGRPDNSTSREDMMAQLRKAFDDARHGKGVSQRAPRDRVDQLTGGKKPHRGFRTHSFGKK